MPGVQFRIAAAVSAGMSRWDEKTAESVTHRCFHKKLWGAGDLTGFVLWTEVYIIIIMVNLSSDPLDRWLNSVAEMSCFCRRYVINRTLFRTGDGSLCETLACAGPASPGEIINRTASAIRKKVICLLPSVMRFF